MEWNKNFVPDCKKELNPVTPVIGGYGCDKSYKKITIRNNTFGSEKEYKSLVCVHNNFNKLNKKRRNYISKFLADLSIFCADIIEVKSDKIANYSMTALKLDYKDKISKLAAKLHVENSGNVEVEIFISHLYNFVLTKIRKTRKERLEKWK